MQQEPTKALKKNGMYLIGAIMAAGGLVLVLSMVVPAVAPLDNLQQIGGRLTERVVPGVFGLLMIVGGFSLMTIGSPGLDVVSWTAEWELAPPNSAHAPAACRCGHENPENSRFCNQCGSKLTPVESLTTPPQSATPDKIEESHTPERVNTVSLTTDESDHSDADADSLTAAIGLAKVASSHDE